MPQIQFFYEKVRFKLPNPRKTSGWIKSAITKEKKEVSCINFIFCSDDHLLSLNNKYLNHNTFTDIITFDYSQPPVLEGEVYISIDRVKENAIKYNVDFVTELHRVMIHGVLHLIGYKDKTKSQKEEMREKEDTYLSLR